MTNRDNINPEVQRAGYIGQTPPFNPDETETITDLRAGAFEEPVGTTAASIGNISPTAAGTPRGTQSGAGTRSSSRRSSKGASSGESASTQAQDTVNKVEHKASQAANTAEQKANQVADQAAAKANQGMDSAASGLSDVASTLRSQAQGMSGEGVSGTLQDAAEMAADKLETAAQFLRQTDPEELMTDLEGLVRRKPVESVLVAAGIGFLLSKVFR